MSETQGSIIFVDDDVEEHDLFKMALSEVCDCNVISAYDGEEAIKMILNDVDRIFAVVSDIRMPKINGFELKRIIDNHIELKLRAIPFIFHSAATDPLIVKEAYTMSIQGFIEKTADTKKTINTFLHFVRFWSLTVHPNVYRHLITLKS